MERDLATLRERHFDLLEELQYVQMERQNLRLKKEVELRAFAARHAAALGEMEKTFAEERLRSAADAQSRLDQQLQLVAEERRGKVLAEQKVADALKALEERGAEVALLQQQLQSAGKAVLTMSCCPLSGRPYVNAHVAPDGQTYSLASITSWLKRQPWSPLTRAPMSPAMLLRNPLAASLVECLQQHWPDLYDEGLQKAGRVMGSSEEESVDGAAGSTASGVASTVLSRSCSLGSSDAPSNPPEPGPLPEGMSAPRSSPWSASASPEMTRGQRIALLLQRNPAFTAAGLGLPLEAWSWPMEDVELFVQSLGQQRPTRRPLQPQGREPVRPAPETLSPAATDEDRAVAVAMDSLLAQPFSQQKKALNALRLRWHPDKNAGSAMIATRVFQFVQAHDDWLAFHNLS